MTLTVPRAGLSAGASASIRVADPQFGDAVAGLGQVMQQVGSALETERRDRERQRGKIGLMQGFADLRLQADQIGDPDALDAHWKTSTAKMRETYLASVDPALRPEAELEFDQLALPHASAVGKQHLDLIQSQRLASYGEQRRLVVAQAAQLGPTDAGALFAENDATIDRMQAMGLIDPAKAQEEKLAFRRDAEAAWATGLLDTDPAALIDAIDNGRVFEGSTPEQTATLRARATSALAAQAAAAERDAKATRAEQISTAKDMLREGRDVFRLGRAFGRQPDADALLSDPEIAALPEAEEYARAAFLFDTMPAFSAMSLADKRAQLAQVASQPITSADENRIAQAMREDIAAHEDAVRKDPWAYAESVGVAQAPALPDPADPGFAAALRDRRTRMARLEGSGIIEGPAPVFRPDEIERLAPLADANASPAQRAQLASQLAAHLTPDQMERAGAELKADPVFATVGTGLAAGALAPATARQIFEGQRVMQDKDVSMAAEAKRREVWFENFGALFGDGTSPLGDDESAVRNAIIASADALYAYRARGNPDFKDGRVNETAWMQAAHEAMGGTGSYGKSDATGGIAELSRKAGLRSESYQVLLPPGIRQGDVATVLDKVTDLLSSARWEFRDDQAQSRIETLLQRLSPDGRLPDTSLFPRENPAETWRRMRLQAVAGGEYRLMATDPGTGLDVMIYGQDGQPWTIDISRLVQIGRGGQ